MGRCSERRERRGAERLCVSRSGVSRILLVVAAVCVGLALSEAMLRVVKRVVCVGGGAKLFRPHPLYGWTHRPDAEGWTYRCAGHAFEWRVFNRIDANGLRDRGHVPARARGVRRVLLLGDSFTEGMQVPYERTFAARLESNLAADGRRVEVIDAGFSGFATDNELLFYRTDGRRYHADLVLLGFTAANDVIENSKDLAARMYAAVPAGPPPKSYFKLRPDGGLRLDTHVARRYWHQYEARRATFGGRLWTALQDRIHLVRFVDSVVSGTRTPSADAARISHAAALGAYAVRPSPEWNRAWALTRALVRELEREVEADGATFGAFVVPAKETVSPLAWRAWLAMMPEQHERALDPERPTTASLAMLRGEGVPTLDLLPPLRAHLAATGGTGYFPLDIHWNEHGHAVVADALTTFVERLLSENDRRPR
jgi:lysophospholipase L1-like esterase